MWTHTSTCTHFSFEDKKETESCKVNFASFTKIKLYPKLYEDLRLPLSAVLLKRRTLAHTTHIQIHKKIHTLFYHPQTCQRDFSKT